MHPHTLVKLWVVPVGQMTKHSMTAGCSWCGMLQQPLKTVRLLGLSKDSDGAEGKPSICSPKTSPQIKDDMNVKQLDRSAKGMRGCCGGRKN